MPQNIGLEVPNYLGLKSGLQTSILHLNSLKIAFAFIFPQFHNKLFGYDDSLSRVQGLKDWPSKAKCGQEAEEGPSSRETSSNPRHRVMGPGLSRGGRWHPLTQSPKHRTKLSHTPLQGTLSDPGCSPGTPCLVGKRTDPQTNMKEQDLGDGKRNPVLCALCVGKARHAGEGGGREASQRRRHQS